MFQRLTEIGRQIHREVAARCAPIAAYLYGAGRLVVPRIASWIVAKFWALVCFCARWIIRFVRWVFVLKDTPLDFVKHYVSVIIAVIGVLALVWSALQIISMPIVITVAKLPDPLEKENWLTPEMSRSLMNQIQRIRGVVKDERTPAFEALLNSPNIVVKSGDWSLNLQEQIITPLGSLLGRTQGEAHIAVTCFQPGCARTSDSECLTPIAGSPSSDQAKLPPKQFLCLRVTVDIQRGEARYRMTPRLTLSNDTYDAELTNHMARIAEAVMAVADPATAALYYYRRIQQERAAARSVTYDSDLLAELRGQAFKAAEQAATHDTVSACWAHSIRARLAIDRREFTIAETYIARAADIAWWKHLLQFTLPADCQRLIAIAEIDLARHLSRKSSTPTYPPHPKDDDEHRVLAAYERLGKVEGNLGGIAAFANSFKEAAGNADLSESRNFVLSDVALSWFTLSDQCRLLDSSNSGPANRAPDLTAGIEYEELDENQIKMELEEKRANAWTAIQKSIKTLRELTPKRPMSPLARQAAVDFMERYARNRNCIEEIQSVARKFYVNHPDDLQVTRLFASVTEAVALEKSAKLKAAATDHDRGNKMLGNARSIYERMLDIGDDKADVFALSRLAFITEAFHAENGDEIPLKGPYEDTIKDVTRAWQRYQRELYPTDSRHHAEFALAFWGALLLRSYPEATRTAVLSPGSEAPANVEKEQFLDAIARKGAFQRALQILFPAPPPATLAEFTKLEGIGRRIGCLCMLMHVTYRKELADFFIARLNKWQRENADLPKCGADLVPPMETVVPEKIAKAADAARRDFVIAKTALEEINPAPISVQKAFDTISAFYAQAHGAWEQADRDAAKARRAHAEKESVANDAEQICRMPRRLLARGIPTRLPR